MKCFILSFMTIASEEHSSIKENPGLSVDGERHGALNSATRQDLSLRLLQIDEDWVLCGGEAVLVFFAPCFWQSESSRLQHSSVRPAGGARWEQRGRQQQQHSERTLTQTDTGLGFICWGGERRKSVEKEDCSSTWKQVHEKLRTDQCVHFLVLYFSALGIRNATQDS